MRQNLILVKPLAFNYLSSENVASKCYVFVRPSYFNQSRVCSIYRKRQFSVDINSISITFQDNDRKLSEKKSIVFFVDTCFFCYTEMIQSFK